MSQSSVVSTRPLSATQTLVLRGTGSKRSEANSSSPASRAPPPLPASSCTPAPRTEFLTENVVITYEQYLGMRSNFTLLVPLPDSIADDVVACHAAVERGDEPCWSRAFSDALNRVSCREWLIWDELQKADVRLQWKMAKAGVPMATKALLELDARITVREKTCLALLHLYIAYTIHGLSRGESYEGLWDALNYFGYYERPSLEERKNRVAPVIPAPHAQPFSASATSTTS
ncbi:hypothetical protein JCM10213_005193 [Rhodosporidiobolus nylandii]